MEHKHQGKPGEQSEELLHCRNCDGYYDPSLPNCPHCGEDTANNLITAQTSSSVTLYEGGFGEAGSPLSRVAAGLVVLLLAAGLLGSAAFGVKLLSRRSAANTPPAVSSAPPEVSAPAEASASAEPKKEKKKNPDQLPPQALRLDYSDLTLVSEGESYQFQVSVEPEDWEGELTWTTDNQNVAVVTPEGKLKSVGKGECGITLSAGEVSYRCLVRCKSGVESDEGGSASVQAYYINGKLMSTDDAKKVIEEERAKAAEKKRKEEEKKRKEAEAKKKAEAEAKKKAEEEAKRKAEEEKRKAAEEEAKRKAEEEAKKKAEEEKRKAEEAKAIQEAEQKAKEEQKKNKSSANAITLQYYDITLVNVGDSFRFEPSGGDGKSYKWSSANSDVASISKDGVVTATGVGQTTLTCKSGDASVDVIVRVRSN